MDNKNTNYSNGIEYAMKQIYDKESKFDIVTKEIEEKYGKEAKDEFAKGYYKALTYFTHAIDYYKIASKYLDKIINNIEESQGEEIKNVFLKGLEYYKKYDGLEEFEQKKK